VGAPGIAVYAATKGAVVALVKSLAREHARDGIIVNSVAPGGVATRAFPTGSEAATRRAERIPMGRLGTPGEIANAIVYMALEAPMDMSGEVLNVSGGRREEGEAVANHRPNGSIQKIEQCRKLARPTAPEDSRGSTDL
jgi:NAD(P)-dependent dehydrogenase (short-subunit alcohol dehydrogenase family)